LNRHGKFRLFHWRIFLAQFGKVTTHLNKCKPGSRVINQIGHVTKQQAKLTGRQKIHLICPFLLVKNDISQNSTIIITWKTLHPVLAKQVSGSVVEMRGIVFLNVSVKSTNRWITLMMNGRLGKVGEKKILKLVLVVKGFGLWSLLAVGISIL
jgi:hypothetical protein